MGNSSEEYIKLLDSKWEMDNVDFEADESRVRGSRERSRQKRQAKKVMYAVAELPTPNLNIGRIVGSLQSIWKLIKFGKKRDVNSANRKLAKLSKETGYDKRLLKDMLRILKFQGEGALYEQFGGYDRMPDIEVVRAQILALIGREQ